MPNKLNSDLINSAINYYIENEISIKKCSEKFGIGASTLSRYLKKEEIEVKKINLKRYSYNEDYFQVIDSENKAYWLGFIAADGCINKTNNLEISLAIKDRTHLEKFIQDINGDMAMLKTTENKARVFVCSVKLVKDLEQYGIFNNKTFSFNSIPNLNAKLIPHFLRGYFDGDGSISTNGINRNGSKKWALNLIATEEFIEEWQEYFLKLGITKVSIQHKGDMRVWNKCGVNQIAKILNHLYSNSNIYLDRKFERANEIFAVLGES